MSQETLKFKITEAIKTAMKAKEMARLGTLRLISAAIKQKEVDERRELDDADVLSILEKQVKQRRESILAFEKAGRDDAASAEKAEILVLQAFLPAQATAEEIEQVVVAALMEVQSTGVSGPAAMGKVVGLAKAKLAGRADMAQVSQLIKSKLA